MSRIFTIVLVMTFLLLQHRIWMSNDGLPAYMGLQGQLEQQKDLIKALESRNLTLMAEVTDLKLQLDAVEERARTDLGMIKSKETFYFVNEG
jgi:cell division protein FtsB